MSFWNDNKGANPNPAEIVNPNPAEVKPPEKTPAELVAESLNPLVEQFKTITDRLNAIEESTRKPAVAQPSEATGRTSIFEDEDKAIAERITPLAMRQLELEARIVASDIKGEYVSAGFGDMLKKYEKEITSQLEASPLVDGAGNPLRGNPSYVRNVIDMILGRAAREGGLRFDGNKQTFFLENASSSAEANATSANTSGLTDAQLKVFRRMGIDPAQGKKTVDKLHFVN